MKTLSWTVIATHVPAGGSLGGVVRYTTELLRALADRDDVVVSALTTRSAADTVRELIGDRGRVTTLPDLPVPLLALVERNLPLPGLNGGVELVQGVKHLVPRRSRAFKVLTVHDMLLIDRAQDFGRAKRLLLPGSYRRSIADADLLLCVSEATRQRVRAQVPGAERRAAVVHLATSSSLTSATPKAIPALMGRQFALVVGDSSPRKNLRTVMAAWPGVRAEIPDAVLAIAGPPSWGETDVGELYDSLVAAGAVVALGHVSDAELRWAYEHAAVALCPSLAEGFGLPAAEALDFGASLIISDDPALAEVAAGRALAVIPAANVSEWTRAITAALRFPARTSASMGRSWAQVAEDSIDAVRHALHKRD